MIHLDELELTAQCLVIRSQYKDEHTAHYASEKIVFHRSSKTYNER